jgi:methyltransferase (TIGR00027 family)
MREGRASITAAIVATARGAAGVDPIAPRLVPVGFAQLARARGLVRRFPLVDLMRARTVAIDEAIEDGVSRASVQLVVLGAGLCARAWRMRALADTTVFEVDHPSTQSYKRGRVEGLEPKAREVRFVGVDFERDDLGAALEKAGHEASARTTWVWEGVTPYLTPAAIARTLDAVRARSAEGSMLVMTYGTPLDGRSADGRGRTLLEDVVQRLARPTLRALGEPLEGLMCLDAAHRVVEEHGFTVKEDATYVELARRMGLRRPKPIVGERLLVAVRRAPS